MTMVTLNDLRDRLAKLESICSNCAGNGAHCDKRCHIGKECAQLENDIRIGFNTVEEDESAE